MTLDKKIGKKLEKLNTKLDQIKQGNLSFKSRYFSFVAGFFSPKDVTNWLVCIETGKVLNKLIKFPQKHSIDVNITDYDSLLLKASHYYFKNAFELLDKNYGPVMMWYYISKHSNIHNNFYKSLIK